MKKQEKIMKKKQEKIMKEQERIMYEKKERERERERSRDVLGIVAPTRRPTCRICAEWRVDFICLRAGQEQACIMRKWGTLPSILPQGPQSHVSLAPFASIWHLVAASAVVIGAVLVVSTFLWVLTRDYSDKRTWNMFPVKQLLGVIGLHHVSATRGRGFSCAQ